MNVPPQGVVFPVMSSLYVGDLHPEVTEGMLYEKFSTAGQVLSLRICRDSRTKQSLGYGYVNFNNPQDAELAMDTMNFDELKGKPMRIMWCQRDPSLRKSGIGNVFIKNLDKSIDNKAMYDTFSAFGNILSCKVALDEQGYSKGYGFVHFESEEVANRAIEKVNGMLLNNKVVYVGKFMPRAERDKELGEKAKMFTNIYVKNFGPNMDDDKFVEMFSKFGTVTSSVVMKNHDGICKGFGFVDYEDAKSAEKAVEEMNGTEYEGKTLYVGRAQKKAERKNELRKKYEQLRTARSEGVNLYIKNLDDSFTNEKLREIFSAFGTITSARIMTENGRSKGFGFVCYTGPEEATKAVSEMHGKIVGRKPLYVALAQRKEARRAFLNGQYLQRANAMRQQQNSITFPTTTPPFLIPAVAQGPARFFNHINPLNHMRPAPRWPQNSAGVPAGGAGTPGGVRPNGTYALPILGNPYRANNRSVQVNHMRNAMHARPIMGQQQQQQQQQAPTSRPNSKYTTNSPNNNNMIRPINLALGNGGDNVPLNTLMNAAQHEQKQIIGEQLFGIVKKFCPDMAAKVTGMLLEIDNSELIHMIKNEESVRAKVEEAIAVLEAHKASQKGVIVQD